MVKLLLVAQHQKEAIPFSAQSLQQAAARVLKTPMLVVLVDRAVARQIIAAVAVQETLLQHHLVKATTVELLVLVPRVALVVVALVALVVMVQITQIQRALAVLGRPVL